MNVFRHVEYSEIYKNICCLCEYISDVIDTCHVPESLALNDHIFKQWKTHRFNHENYMKIMFWFIYFIYIYQLMFLEASVTWVIMWNLRKIIEQLSHCNCDMQFTIMMHIKWNILHINKAYNPWISSANVLP